MLSYNTDGYKCTPFVGQLEKRKLLDSAFIIGTSIHQKYTTKHPTIFLKVGNMHKICPSQYNEKGCCCKIRTVSTPTFCIAQEKSGFRNILQIKCNRKLPNLCRHAQLISIKCSENKSKSISCFFTHFLT